MIFNVKKMWPWMFIGQYSATSHAELFFIPIRGHNPSSVYSNETILVWDARSQWQYLCCSNIASYSWISLQFFFVETIFNNMTCYWLQYSTNYMKLRNVSQIIDANSPLCCCSFSRIVGRHSMHANFVLQ